MQRTERLAAIPIAAGVFVVGAIYAAAIAIARSAMFARDPDVLAAAITLDLTVTATAAAYWLGVRRGRLPAIALVPVFAIGLVVARLVLPAEHRAAVSILAAGWSIVELAIAALIAVKLRSVVRCFGERRRAGESAIGALEAALESALGHRIAARLLAHELSLLWLATAGLFRRPPPGRNPDRAEAIWPAVLLGLGIALFAEGFALHLLLRAWSPAAAAVAAVLQIYTALWLLGDWRALRLSTGVTAGPDALRIDLGLRARARIPRDQIQRIERVDDGADLGDHLRLTVRGRPNVLVHLATPATVRLLFNRERHARVIGLSVADPDALASVIDH